MFNLFPPGGRVHRCFGFEEPSTSGGRKHSTRKNNEHWTQDEMRKLVNDVSEYGVGKWKDVKTKYFLTSIGTSVHLKVRMVHH
jgi:hypothetical protein